MLQKLLLLVLLCICFCTNAQFKISGQILDQNNKPLEGCHVHIKNKNINTDAFGNYSIENLSKGNIKIFVSNFGYQSISSSIFLGKDLILNLKMIVDVKNLDDVLVNAKRNSENNSVLEQKIKIETIEKYGSQTLGDALKEIAGVSILRTGSNIVKPVINGLHSSRIPIISNNVRLEDQQWGSEHAPNFDLNAAGKVTVIKGASGLQYGGDAIGGLIVIDSYSSKNDTLFGKTISNLSSNGRGGTLSTSLHKGNFCDWSWNAVGTFKYFGDRNSANYVLSNSGNRELNFSGDAKYTGKKFDVSGFYSLYNAQIGILSASHIGNANDLYLSINRQIPSVVNDFTYNLLNPKQDVKHHLAKINFNYSIDDDSSIAFQYSYQNNKRLEFDVRRGELKNIAALDLELSTHTLKIDYKKEFHNWNLKSGFNAENQENIADSATKVRPLIPNYQKNDFGVYSIANYPISETLTIDFGVRYDFSDIQAFKFYLKERWEERNFNEQFSGFIIGEIGNQWFTKPSFTFHNFSGCFGLHKKFSSELNWYANASLATRNPNPSEFFSDGLHHSTGQIEFGDLGLQKEQSYKLSTTLQKKWSNFSIEVNPFVNNIKNFIFLQPTSFEKTTRGVFPVWSYLQTNALMTGLDINSTWKITELFQHQFSFAAVNGFDLSNNKPLIAMPPINFSNKILFAKKSFHGLLVELKNEVVLRQTQFPDNNFSTKIIQNNEFIDVQVEISMPTNAYQLWSFYSELKFKTFKTGFATIAFSVQNILNTNYRDYLNAQRFYVDELGRNFQIQLKLNY
jgi:iron complex outermembrane recepter protein